MAELTNDDKELLDFERSWWKYPGAKDSEIRKRFGISATHYYQRLNALVEQPEALAYDVMVVKRLRRVRAARHRQRSSSRIAE